MSGACLASLCDDEGAKAGYCSKHYQRVWKHGDAEADGHTPPKYSAPPPTHPLETPCLIYRGPLNQHGYPVPCFGTQRKGKGRRQVLLSRWLVEQVECRTLPRDEVVRHRCDTPACFRYDHLLTGTQADNNADARERGRARPPEPKRGSDNVNAKLTEEQARIIRSLRGSAGSLAVGKQFGVSGALVRDIWLGKAWAHLSGSMPAARNVSIKLTDEDVREIRTLKGRGPSRIVADRFGVSGSTIREIWAGKSRSDVK